MKTKAVLILLFILIFPAVTVNAASSDAYSVSGADKLESKEVTEEEKSGKKQINIGQKILNIITAGLSSNIKGALKALGLLTGILIVISVIKNTVAVSGGKTVSTACDFISAAVFSAAVYAALSPLFKYCISALSSLSVYTKALIPVMASLYSLAGCVNSAVSNSASSYAFLTFTGLISSDVILPTLNVGFAFSLAASLPGSTDLSSVCGLIKKTVCTVLSFVFVLFGFAISVKSVMALSADRLAFRELKFVSGTAVPVIGGVIGESTRTVFASVGVIKSTVGTVGIISILSLMLPPIIAVFLYRIVLSLCSTLAKSVSLGGEAKLIDGMNELMGILLAITVGVSAVFLIICGIFMKAGVDL